MYSRSWGLVASIDEDERRCSWISAADCHSNEYKCTLSAIQALVSDSLKQAQPLHEKQSFWSLLLAHRLTSQCYSLPYLQIDLGVKRALLHLLLLGFL